MQLFIIGLLQVCVHDVPFIFFYWCYMAMFPKVLIALGHLVGMEHKILFLAVEHWHAFVQSLHIEKS